MSTFAATAITSGVRVSCEPAEVARAREREQHHRRAEQPDAQVRQRVRVRRVRTRPSRRRSSGASASPTIVNDAPSPSASQIPATPCSAAARSSPRADAAGDGGGRAVGEEVEDPERRRQHRARDREPAERPGAEAADDRGVGEHVQRLGDERTERGEREAPDLPVVGMAPEHRGPCASRANVARCSVTPVGLNRRVERAPTVRFASRGAPSRRGHARGRAHRARVPHAAASPRSPAYDPRLPGGPVVAVRLQGRIFAEVVHDMVDGVVVANRLEGELAGRVRATLLDAHRRPAPTAPPPRSLTASPARVAERQTQAA